jgi:hypothetical protein
MYVCMYVYMHACTYVCMYVRTYVCVCVVITNIDVQNPWDSPLLQMRFRSGLKNNMPQLLTTFHILTELDITAESIDVMVLLVLLHVQIL